MEPTDVKVDKRTKEYKETVQGDKGKEPYAKIQDNPGFKLCMMCGCELPPNEDGTPKWRRWPTPCDECVNKNRGRKITDENPDNT